MELCNGMECNYESGEFKPDFVISRWHALALSWFGCESPVLIRKRERDDIGEVGSDFAVFTGGVCWVKHMLLVHSPPSNMLCRYFDTVRSKKVYTTRRTDNFFLMVDLATRW